jgi:hypothetical protein
MLLPDQFAAIRFRKSVAKPTGSGTIIAFTPLAPHSWGQLKGKNRETHPNHRQEASCTSAISIGSNRARIVYSGPERST